jgi:hypothetical protein
MYKRQFTITCLDNLCCCAIILQKHLLLFAHQLLSCFLKHAYPVESILDGSISQKFSSFPWSCACWKI